MPRFFFHQAYGNVDHDDDGVMLTGLEEARREAMKWAGGFLADHPDFADLGQDLRIEVTDEEARIVFTVVVVAINSQPLVGLEHLS